MKRAPLLLDTDNIKSRYTFACMLAARLEQTDAALELLERVFENVSIGQLNHAKADRTSIRSGIIRSSQPW
jgi:hypothetical protein